MLEHTFCHIKGIGQKTEEKLWQKGIHIWSDWTEQTGIPLSKQSRFEIPFVFEESQRALERGDPHFFCSRLSNSDRWRIFSHFRKSLAFIDIETTGLGHSAEITTIALYDGNRVQTYINGQNLQEFVKDVQSYSVLASYNGTGFDIPCIENYFRISLPHAQIDLRFILARLGFRGGLKGCERQLGINRGLLDGVDGSFAIHLWHLFDRFGDTRALETLLAYNIEDTVNLERLLVHAWNLNVAKTPFAEQLSLPFPQPPRLSFQPDADCVAEIQRRFGQRTW